MRWWLLADKRGSVTLRHIREMHLALALISFPLCLQPVVQTALLLVASSFQWFGLVSSDSSKSFHKMSQSSAPQLHSDSIPLSVLLSPASSKSDLPLLTPKPIKGGFQKDSVWSPTFCNVHLWSFQKKQLYPLIHWCLLYITWHILIIDLSHRNYIISWTL